MRDASAASAVSSLMQRTDTLTGLIWLKDADCLPVADFEGAKALVAMLGDGTHPECNLTDGSSPGDWRLPTKDVEVRALLVTDGVDANDVGVVQLGRGARLALEAPRGLVAQAAPKGGSACRDRAR